jgi:hypothetical protein
MKDLRFLCQLDENERVVRILRLHASELWLSVLPWGMALCGVSFFLFFLLRGGALGIALAVALVLASVYGILHGFARWDGTAFALTNKRLIVLRRHQLWSRSVEEILLAEIRHVEARKRGTWRRLFKLSHLVVKGGQNQSFAMRSVSNADRFVEALKEARKML